LTLGNARLGLSARGQQIQEQRLTQQQQQFVTRMETQIQEFNRRQSAAGQKMTLPNASLSRAEGWLVDGSGNVILRGGKPVLLPGFQMGPGGTPVKLPGGTGANGVKPLTTNEVRSFVNGLKLIRTSKDSTTGQEQATAIFRMPYNQAYTELRQGGVTDQTARKWLDTIYRKGEGGRGWLTNAQQGVLRKSSLPMAGMTTDGQGYLVQSQVRALTKAKMMPAGSWQTAGGQKVYVIKQTY
jgi:hypothetical protein